MKKKLLIFCFWLILLSSFANAALTDNIISYYHADSNTDYPDELNNLNLTGISSPVFNSTCINNGCYEYDSILDYHTNSPIANVQGLTGFTVCAWFNPYDTGNEAGIDIGTRHSGGMTLKYNPGTNKMRAFIRTTNEAEYEGAQTIVTQDTWVHACGVYANNRGELYINGTNETSDIFVSGTPTFAEIGGAERDRIRIGAGNSNLINDNVDVFFGGTIDEVGIWNRTLSQTEITELYNSGAGKFYPFTDVTVNNFSISAQSVWDNSTITNFSAEINGTIYNTTNGTLYTDILDNSTSLHNITVFSTEWFNSTYLNYNVSTDLLANLSQTNITLRFIFRSGDIINFSNISINDSVSTNFFTTTNGILNIAPNATNITFLINDSQGLFDPFNYSFSFTSLENATYNITINETNNTLIFLDSNTTNAIDNATITIYYPSGSSDSFTTDSNGQINFSYIFNNTLELGEYTFEFDKLGYQLLNITETINSTNIPINETYNISRATLIINIYDRDGNPFLYNTTISMVGVFNQTTDTGQLIKNNLTVTTDEYVIYASSDGFRTETRYFNYTNQENLTINFYMLNLSISNIGILTINALDSFYRKIVGADLELLQYDPDTDSFISVSECKTNIDAQCDFTVELNTKIYYVSGFVIINNILFGANTGDDGEIFTNVAESRNLIFYTRSTFEVEPSTNLIYDVTEDFTNNISSISVDFYSYNGDALTVCIEYFTVDGNDYTSVLSDCLTSTSASQNVNTEVTLNRSNTYEARIYISKSSGNVPLEKYYYPSVRSISEVFDNTFIGGLIMVFWIVALAFSVHTKNMVFWFGISIILAWIQVLIFPLFSIVILAVLKNVISIFTLMIARKKKDFN